MYTKYIQGNWSSGDDKNYTVLEQDNELFSNFKLNCTIWEIATTEEIKHIGQKQQINHSHLIIDYTSWILLLLSIH